MATITVRDWERGLLYVDGRFGRVLEPGRHRYRKGRAVVYPVDMRDRTLVVSGQELLTADGLTVKVSVLATWRVTDPQAFLTGAVSPEQTLHSALQLAVRDNVATATFDQVIADRAGLSTGLVEAAAGQVAALGIELRTAVVKDLMLPGELRRAATETVLAREAGRAELERARAEAASLRVLANAARLLEEHPALLRLRTIQVAGGPGTTVVLTPDPEHLPPRS